jgi:Protein kinase domain
MSEPTPSGPIKGGTTFGAYTIVGRLGSGGMGEVYRARDNKLERDVAVKVLLPDVAASNERISRFQREARVLAALNHPRIAAIYGFDDLNGTPALVRELVEGPTLADRPPRWGSPDGGRDNFQFLPHWGRDDFVIVAWRTAINLGGRCPSRQESLFRRPSSRPKAERPLQAARH